MGALSAVAAGLKLLNAFVKYLGTKRLIDLGAAKAIGESLSVAQRRTQRAIEIRREVDNMPSNDLLDELRKSTRED